MDTFDWKLTIKANIIMLKMVGLWPAGDETYKFNIYTLYTTVSILAFVYGHNFFQAFNIIFILDDIEALTATIFVLLTDMLAIMKSYYLIQNIKIIKQLMVTLNSEMFQPKNLRQKDMIEPSLNSWKMVYTVFSSMAYSTLFFWGTFPFLDNLVQQHQLPFLAWYPWNAKVSPLYEITYAYQMASVSFICILNLNIDTLIAALNMYTGAQCDILCDDLRHIHEFADINARLKSCVAAFSSQFYSSLFYVSAVVVEIFMYCWYGNEVEIKSSNIPYAVFESDWTETSLEVQKHIVFFILRCQKPIKLSALNLFYLTLDTFVTIMRTSWSYFAILHQVSEK
ncbi:odorant receptor 4-like [Zophobas morio]|uniref:odorant receptor 4-like n=1 Tax=Zophobas morio TaxID=2755281 RepID=UPI003082FF19